MQFTNKYIIFALIILIIIITYYFAIPFIRHLILDQDTKKLYAALKESHIPWKVFAKSEQDRDIYLFEQGEGEPTTLILAAMHGDEQNTFHLAVKLADTIYSKPELIDNKVVIVPVVNPDGLLRNERINANDVDINRNFPTENWRPIYKKYKYNPGYEAGSEKETQAVMELINLYQPDKLIVIHADLHVLNYDGPAKDLVLRMAEYNGYRVESNIGYPTPGSLGTYAGVEGRIPTVTLELPDNSPEKAWKQNFKALIQAINFSE
jgi:protein MpaA